MQTVTLEIPDELVALAGIRKDQLSHDTLKLVVLELFREDLISLGKAAELCGLSIAEFMEFSASRQVPLHYSTTDLQQDRENFESLKK